MRLGKFLPSITAVVPGRPQGGVMVTSRAGKLTNAVPSRPPLSRTRSSRGPARVVAELMGRSMDADQPPPRSSRTGPLPPFIREGSMGWPPMLMVSISVSSPASLKPMPDTLMRWLGRTSCSGVTRSRALLPTRYRRPRLELLPELLPVILAGDDYPQRLATQPRPVGQIKAEVQRPGGRHSSVFI